MDKYATPVCRVDAGPVDEDGLVVIQFNAGEEWLYTRKKECLFYEERGGEQYLVAIKEVEKNVKEVTFEVPGVGIYYVEVRALNT